MVANTIEMQRINVCNFLSFITLKIEYFLPVFVNILSINLNIIQDGGWHFTNLKTPDEMYEKFMNFGHHDEFRLSGLTIEKIRDKILNKEMFYDHLADKSSTNKWESNYKLKVIGDEMLPSYLIKNKNKYREWFSD